MGSSEANKSLCRHKTCMQTRMHPASSEQTDAVHLHWFLKLLYFIKYSMRPLETIQSDSENFVEK